MLLEQAFEAFALCGVGGFRGGDEECVLRLVYIVRFALRRLRAPCTIRDYLDPYIRIYPILTALRHNSRGNGGSNAPERSSIEHREELRSGTSSNLAEQPEGDPEGLGVQLANGGKIRDNERLPGSRVVCTSTLLRLHLFCPLQSPANRRPRVGEVENEDGDVHALREERSGRGGEDLRAADDEDLS